MCAPTDSVIVVGHSLLFRALFARILPSSAVFEAAAAEGARAHSFASVSAELASELREGKLENCGCVALELDFGAGLTPTVRACELLFGTSVERGK